MSNRIVGRSAFVSLVWALLKDLADKNTNLLLIGEPGTGKRLIARAFHAASNQNSQPFRTIDCQKPAEFDEVFASRPGLGTLYLTDIDHLSDTQQLLLLKLVRAPANFGTQVPQLLASASRDPEALLRKGGDLETLYREINAIRIQVPPLRHRKEDIIPLSQHFLRLCAEVKYPHLRDFTDKALTKLCSWDYRNKNAQELKETVERAALSTRGALIDESAILAADNTVAQEEEAIESEFFKG